MFHFASTHIPKLYCPH